MMSRSFETFTIGLPADFNREECLWFMDRGFYDCRYRIRHRTVWKLLDGEQAPCLVRIRFEKNSLKAGVWKTGHHNTDEEVVTKHIRNWFDLDRDLTGFYRLAASDPVLGDLISRYRGLRLIGEPDLFETLCWAIIGQQVNLSFAYRMKQNLVERYGEHLTHDDHTYYAFPSPGLLAGLQVEDLKELQLSRQKAKYIINLARLFSEGRIGKDQLREAADFDSRLNKLTDIHGIGPWTAHYALMRSLKEMEAFPYSDAGLLNALKNRLQLDGKPSVERVKKMAAAWSGWKAYAVLYLWRSLADQ